MIYNSLGWGDNTILHNYTWSHNHIFSVPVNFLRPKDGSQRFYKEKVSYEHMYNSRLDPNYPIRGKVSLWSMYF